METVRTNGIWVGDLKLTCSHNPDDGRGKGKDTWMAAYGRKQIPGGGSALFIWEIFNQVCDYLLRLKGRRLEASRTN